MNKVHYDVTSLLNSQIKTQIKNVLEEDDGVKKVNVDLGKSCIDVEYNKATNENNIRQGINHVGCKIQ